MYVQGVSTRKVKAITEELCGHEFSASAISDINKTLDEASRPSPSGGCRRTSPISSSMPATSGCARPA
jgi:hypothetical protein